MTPNLKSNKKKKSGLLSATDIMKGFTSLSNVQDIWTMQPLQGIPQEEKDEAWKRWNADWHEAIALRELPKKAKRLERLYNLAAGIINKSDYIPSGDNDMSNHLGVIGETEQDIFSQFFPIVPNIIQVFMGEFIKRDKSVVVQADDPETLNEKLQYKEDLVNQIIEQYKMSVKQSALIKAGIVPSDNPEDEMTQRYEQEIQTEQQLIEAEAKFRKFRSKAEEWAQKFIEKFGTKNGFDEMELWAFSDSLIADEAIMCLNLRENDFTCEQLQPKKTYINQPESERYYSKCNFAVHVDFMTIPGIINMFRNDLTAEQVEKLEQYYNQELSSNILFATQNGRSDTYYDTSQSYDWNAQRSTNLIEEQSADTVKNYFKKALSGNSGEYSNCFNDVKQIRVSRIWWPSMRKHGLLTKIEEGNPEPIIERVDENFLVTELPEYDNSLLEEKSAKTLIKGEHVDWKVATQWRYIVKIGRNIPQYYKLAAKENHLENIYLYGDPIRFQFKGDDNIYDAKPPIEGCKFSNINNRSVGLVESMKPWQIVYNVLNNKGVALLPKDYGKVLVLPDSNIKKNSLMEDDGLEPMLEALDSIRDTGVLNIDDSKETAMNSNNRYSQPVVVDMTNIEAAAMYFQAAQAVKGFAFEGIGVSPQRASQVGNRETATGVNAAVEGSVNQTELRFELFSTYYIPRVWQMVLDAAQYYTTMSEEFSDIYLNSEEDNAFFSVLKTDLLLRQLFVSVKSKADIRKLLSDLKQLTMQDNTMGATFLDKVKTYISKSPNEIISQLQKAEEQRQQQEQSKQEQELQVQREQTQMLEQQKEKDRALNAKQFDDNLANQRYIAEIKVQQSAMTPPPDNSLEYDKLGQQQMQMDNQNQQAERSQQFAEQKHKDDTEIKRQEIAQKDRTNQSKETIAVQNKSYADLKFQQMQKNKAKAK